MLFLECRQRTIRPNICEAERWQHICKCTWAGYTVSQRRIIGWLMNVEQLFYFITTICWHRNTPGYLLFRLMFCGHGILWLILTVCDKKMLEYPSQMRSVLLNLQLRCRHVNIFRSAFLLLKENIHSALLFGFLQAHTLERAKRILWWM
jgi:hypothetical protein